MPDNNRAGLQRVRVGLTGLGAVLLIVAISAAIFETATNQPDANAAAPSTEMNVSNMLVNEAEPPADPLTEIGVTPSAPTTPADNRADVSRK